MLVITGAAGLIGGRLAQALTNERVLLTDRLGGEQRSTRLPELQHGLCLDADEFLRRIEADRGLPKLTAIIHLGAATSTTETDRALLERNNTAYTRTLAQWCLRHGVRFIYASSAATYGDGSRGYSDSLDGLGRLSPLNLYGQSKHDFDLWARDNDAFRYITGLKYFNVYGPNEAHKGDMRSMVLKAFEQIQATGRVRLFKSYRTEYRDGEQERDFIYVDDAVAMTAWFLDHPEATGIFNIGAGVARTWNDLAKAVFVAMGCPVVIEYADMPETIRAQYQYSTCADMSRVYAAGCPLRARSLEDGVRAYVHNYLLAS